MDRKENQIQNQISIRNSRRPNQITSDSGMLQMHSKAVKKLDHTVDYFKCLEGETKQVVNQFNQYKSSSENFLDQIKEEKQTNISKGGS